VRFHDPRPLGIVEVAKTYEQEGWDGTVFADSQSIAPDAFVILTMIAMSTKRIRFTTGVTVPLTRQPAVVASAAAAIQEISGGRMQLAIGRGDTALAYLGLSPTRLATFEKFATQVKRYLAGDTLSLPEVAPVMEGAVHGFEDLAVGNGPEGSSLIWMDRAQPRVPVEIAATGPKALEMAASSTFEILAATHREGADELMLPRFQHAIAHPRAPVNMRRLGSRPGGE